MSWTFTLMNNKALGQTLNYLFRGIYWVFHFSLAKTEYTVIFIEKINQEVVSLSDPLHFTDTGLTQWPSFSKRLQKLKVFQKSSEHNDRIIGVEDEGEICYTVLIILTLYYGFELWAVYCSVWGHVNTTHVCFDEEHLINFSLSLTDWKWAWTRNQN